MIGIRAVLVFLLMLSAGDLTRSQTPPDVRVKLLLADSKTTFRIGEPIRLVLEFTADTPGFNVDILPERQQPTFDTISVSPRPVTSSHLSVVSSLRFLLESRGVPFETKVGNGMMWPTSDPQQLEIQNRYLSELALSLNKRKGESLVTTAFTVLTMTMKDAENRATLIGEARRVLIQQFDSISIFGKEQLLRVYWDDLCDPALLGSLKLLLADNSRLSKGVHRLAAERLLDLSREEARPYYIAQICDPTSFGDLEVLWQLSDKSLPEVDTCLLEQLRRLKNPIDNYTRVWLQSKAALASAGPGFQLSSDLNQVLLF